MTVEISLLGELQVTRDGERVEIGSAKQRALLAMLAVEAGTFLSTDRLIDALWAGEPPSTAAKNLQVLVGRLRDALEPERRRGAPSSLIIGRPGGYLLDADSIRCAEHDFVRVMADARTAHADEDWVRAASLAHDALALWRGAPLEDVCYEDWAAPHVARLQEQHAAACVLWLDAQLAMGRTDRVLDAVDVLIARHRFDERLRALKMLALYRSGRQADALAEFHAARAELVDGIGVEPGPALRELERRILAHDALLAGPGGLEASPGTRPVDVPATGMFGRERELRELAGIIDQGHGLLVTITGWGGTGKTRIAHELARTCLVDAEPAVFVDLSPITDASTVGDAIAAAFGITVADGDPIDSVAFAIGDRRLLVVLDNFEQIMSASGLVARLRDACPNACLVVTSRAPLHVDGEHEYPLDPLALPTERELLSPVAVLGNAAVQLFEARARTVDSSFRVHEGNALDVAGICARVDGLPLGIELAAARTKLLGPTAILERLDHRLALLTSGSPDVPRRQQSLRAAIEWSYELLDDRSQALLRSLSVFVGGCTVSAALQIAGATPESEIDLLDRLEALVDQRLLRREIDALGEVRLTMFETIHEFASEQLAVSALDTQVAGDAHATWAAEVVALGDTRAAGPAAVAARTRLHIEMKNVRSAIDWALAHDVERAGDLFGRLERYFATQGSFVDAAALAARVMSVADRMSAPCAARAGVVAGGVFRGCGMSSEADACLSRSLSLFQELEDDVGVASALNVLSEVAMTQGQVETALEQATGALRSAESAGNLGLQGLSRNNRGVSLLEADRASDARAEFDAARRLFADDGDALWMATATMNVACADCDLGRLEEARRGLELSAAMYLDLSDSTGYAHCRCNLAHVFLDLADAAQAQEVLVAVGDQVRASGDQMLACYAATLGGWAAIEIGSVDVARKLAVEGIVVARRIGRFYWIDMALALLARTAEEWREDDIIRPLWSLVDESTLRPSSSLDRRISEWRRLALGLVEPELGRCERPGPLERAEEALGLISGPAPVRTDPRSIELDGAALGFRDRRSSP